MEEEHVRHGRIAGELLHDPGVDRRLRRLVGRRHVLRACVGAGGARHDADLPADLGDREAEPVLERRLRGAVERVPDRLLDPVQVRDARVRPRESLLERVGRRARVGVEREGVHDRPGAPARVVGRADVVDELHGRMGGVARRARVVVAPFREPEPEHADRVVDALQGVVAAREELLVAVRRRVRAVGAELRLPVARLVRLVADDEVGHLRIRPREPLQEVDELRLGGRARREHPRPQGIDGEDDPDPAGPRLRQHTVEEARLGHPSGEGRVPVDRDRVLGQSDVVQLRVERGAAIVRVLAGVLGDAIANDAGRSAGEEERSDGARECRNRSTQGEESIGRRAATLEPVGPAGAGPTALRSGLPSRRRRRRTSGRRRRPSR